MSRLFESSDDGDDGIDFPVVSPLADFDPEAALDDGPILAPLDAPLAPITPLGPPPVPAESHSALRTDDAGPRSKVGESTLPSGDYEIPDFEQDERDLTNYEDAKRRHVRQQIATAESAIQASFQQKREQLRSELKNAKSFDEERRTAAVFTTRQYANRYPQHVDKKGVSPPTFFENLFSFGSAGRLYRAAYTAGEALEQLRAATRKREEALAALDGQLSRAIYLKEESIKKSMETQAGIDEFNNRPEIKGLYKRVESVKKERERYEKRIERGEVSDDEQRDRAVKQFKLVYAELPIMGAIIAKVARFGGYSYFQLRDLEKKESLLSYDPRLDALRNSVFDVYSVAGAVAAKLRRNDNGTAFRVADHFKACWRNQDEAEELYGQHRAALREDRGLVAMTPRGEGEAEIIERLANLATLVDGGQGRSMADAAPPASTNAPRS